MCACKCVFHIFPHKQVIAAALGGFDVRKFDCLECATELKRENMGGSPLIGDSIQLFYMHVRAWLSIFELHLCSTLKFD